MRRWSLRILYGFLGLIVLVVIGVQVVLWTNIPKDLVVRQIESEMGLRISTDSLRTGWLGNSTLQNVALGLPLSQESFLQVKTLKVKHTTLFGLLFGRAVSIDSIEIDQPQVFVQQDVNGRWNLQEVAELLARVGGGNTAVESQKQDIPKLPNVRLIDGTVHVTHSSDLHATLTPVNFEGRNEGSLVWKFNAHVSDAVTITGEVAPGGSWKHQAKLAAHDMNAMLKDWGVDSHHADTVGEWSGAIVDGKVKGTLVLDRLTANDVPSAGTLSITGAVDVEAGGGTVTLRPRRIDFRTSNPALSNVWLAAGTIVKDANGFHAQSMQVATLGGLAVLDASFDPRTFAGDLQARWSGLALSSGMNHSGSITGRLRMPFAGHPDINVDIVSNGETESGKWNANLNIAGRGESWQSIDWVMTAPTLAWNGSRPIQLGQLIAHVTQRWPNVELTDLSLPDRPHLSAKAAANFRTNNWYFWLDAGGMPRADSMPLPISFSINSWGDDKLWTLHELNLQISDAVIWAGGYYDRLQPNPVNLDVVLTQAPHMMTAAPIEGHLGGFVNLTGQLFKQSDGLFHPKLNIHGHMKSNDLIVLERPLGSLDLELAGTVDNFDTKVQTTDMSLFQGKWQVTANYPTSLGGMALKVDVHDLPVEQLAAFAKVENVTGNVTSASWRFELPRGGGINQLILDGNYVVQNINARGFEVDRIEGAASMDSGVLKLAPLAAQYQTGRADAAITYDLNNPGHLLTDVKLDKWPHTMAGGAKAALSAQSKLDIDLGHKGAAGLLGATVDLQLKSAPLSHVELFADIRGRAVTIHRLNGNLLTGTFDGSAAVDIDKPLLGQGRVQWDKVDAAALSAIAPQLEGLGGIYRGTISISPAHEPRPLEPLRVDVNVSVDNGHYRSVRIGNPDGVLAMHAVAYANLDRGVLDHCDLRVAGGALHLWARAGNGLTSQALQISFEDLQLNQLAHLSPKLVDKPMPGLVSGRFSLIGSGLDTNKLLGDGKIFLRQTDLGNWGPVAFLYNVMNGSSDPSPKGYGSVTLRFEQNALRVPSFRFFNRGIEARGIFAVGPNIWNLPNTPFTGQMVGTLRALKDSKLSFLADFDEVFSILQGSLTTINIGGSVETPVYVQALVSQINSDLRVILVGDARAESGSQ